MTGTLADWHSEVQKMDSTETVDWESLHFSASRVDFDCGSDWSLVDSSLVSSAAGTWAASRQS